MARDDWKARRGSRNSGPYAEGAGDSGPVDIAAVRRDDALIDAIAGGGPVQTDSPEEFQLASLLADWRAELVAPDLPADPDLDTVFAAVNQEIGARKVRVSAANRGRLRLVGPIAGTAAALALVFGGVTAFSYNAEPGDPLWRVKEVVFSEQAQTTVVARADSELTQAQQAIEQGNAAQARALLERAQVNVSQVSDDSTKQDLATQWQRLLAELRGISPEIAAQLEQTLDPTAPTTPGSTTPVPPTSDVTNTIMGVPPESSTTQEPSDTEPTEPPTRPTTPPVDTTAPTTPPVEPTTPPTSAPTTPPTAVPTSAGTVAPTRTHAEDGPGTITIPIPNIPGLPGGEQTPPS